MLKCKKSLTLYAWASCGCDPPFPLIFAKSSVNHCIFFINLTYVKCYAVLLPIVLELLQLSLVRRNLVCYTVES